MCGGGTDPAMGCWQISRRTESVLRAEEVEGNDMRPRNLYKEWRILMKDRFEYLAALILAAERRAAGARPYPLLRSPHQLEGA